MVALPVIAVVLSIAFLSAANVHIYTIKPTVEISCHSPLAIPCLTLTEFAREEQYISANTTLEFLPGEHTLDRDFNIWNATNFTMLGSPSSRSAISGSLTTINCVGPATISISVSLEVTLQSIEFIHCGSLQQPAILVSSVEYFEMVDCSVMESRGVGLVANFSAISLYNTVFHNNTHTGLIVVNGIANFTGNATFTRNSNMSVMYGGGLAGFNASIQFFGITTFLVNVAEYGGGVYVTHCTIAFQGQQTFIHHLSAKGGAIHAEDSSVNVLCNNSPNHTYHSQITDNSATIHGGGVYLERSMFYCNSTMVITGNTALDTGGGMAAFDSSLELHNYTYLMDNTAPLGGGIGLQNGILVNRGTLVVDSNNANRGGGMSVQSSSVASDGNMVFDSNTASLWGGGLNAYLYSSLFLSSNIILQNNSAYLGGGMSILEHCDLRSNGTLAFDNNRADLAGGGILAYVSFISISGIANNSAFHGEGVNLEESSQFIAIYSAASTQSFGESLIFIHNSAGVGGAVAAYKHSYMSYSGSVIFCQNSAVEGGGISVEDSKIISNGSMLFHNNTVTFLGGGVLGSSSSLHFQGNITLLSNSAFQGGGMSLEECNVSFDGITLFHSNTAEYFGGGITLISSTYPCTLCNTANFQKSVKFTKNKAVFGGGFLSLDGNVTFSGNAEFHNNSAVISTDNSGYGGGFFGYRSVVYFLENSAFTGNSALEGGGMYGSYTTITVSGNMSVLENSALVSGGGFYFTSGSTCWLTEHSSVLLSNNHANQFGGGVYIISDPFFYCINIILPTIDYPGQPNCFFQPTAWPTTATVQILANNYAEEAGGALYGGSLDQCVIQAWNSTSFHQGMHAIFHWIFQDESFLDNEQADPSLISSDPIRVCLCTSDKPQCNVTEYDITVYPGETVRIPVVATGERNGTVPSVITATVADSGVDIENHQKVQSANRTCTTLEYNVYPLQTVGFDPSVNYSMIIRSESPCQAYGTPLQINIRLRSCPNGFEFSNTLLMSCMCSIRIQIYTNTCHIDSQSILRHGQYWIGWDGTSNGAILHSHCPFDYCTSKNTSFPLNNTDRQCQHNRAGLLCGGCRQGYSVGFGSTQCRKCDTNVYLTLILVCVIAGVVLVAFLLTCKLTVAMGTINGLIFYANIVIANQGLYFPEHNSRDAFLRLFIAWINLDIGLETCFFRGMDMNTRTWLQFVFPLYIWGLVGIIIILCHYFSWATRLFGSNPVAVLATLFLLSYTKLLRTVITALSVTYLDYPNNPHVLVWLYDGNIGYLEAKHIILVLASIVVLVVLFLPYTLLLFFGQWIEAGSKYQVFRWINNYRVKAFLDAYYGPFKNSYRYWPGLLLISRVLLLLVFAFNVFGDPSINLLATITCAVGLLSYLVVTGAVYNQTYNHLLELSFLVNTLALAACTMAPVLTDDNQLVVTYTSVGIAFAIFLGILAYHTVIQIINSGVWKHTIKPRLQHNQHARQADRYDHYVTANRTGVTSTVVDLRELVSEESCDQQHPIQELQCSQHAPLAETEDVAEHCVVTKPTSVASGSVALRELALEDSCKQQHPQAPLDERKDTAEHCVVTDPTAVASISFDTKELELEDSKNQ